MKIDGFPEIPSLPPNATVVSSIGVDFNDKTQPASFDISFDGRQLPTPLSISCHVGELIEQKFLNEKDFNQNSGRPKIDFISTTITSNLARLRGMNELSDSIDANENQMQKFNFTTVQTKILQCANLSSVPSGSGDSTIYRYLSCFFLLQSSLIFLFFPPSRFSGQTISSKSLVLLTIQLNHSESVINLTINSDRIVLATMLLKEIKQSFS